MSSHPDFKVHVFICQSCRYTDENGDLCHPDTTAELKKRVKAICKQIIPKDKLRVNSSGCLGQCETGLNAVIYPEGQWHINLRAGDEQKLSDAAIKLYEGSLNPQNLDKN